MPELHASYKQGDISGFVHFYVSTVNDIIIIYLSSLYWRMYKICLSFFILPVTVLIHFQFFHPNFLMLNHLTRPLGPVP